MNVIRFGLLLAMALCVAGCGGKATLPPRPPLLVRAQPAHFEDYATTISLTGTIKARTQADLSFRIDGRVVEWDADVGQHVEAGAVLAKIDPTEQQADLDSANAAVASAQAVMRQASTNFDRQKSLIDSGFTTRSTYDLAQESLRTAQGSLDAANAQAGATRNSLSFTELRATQAGIITARNIEIGQVAQAAQAAFTLAVDGPRDAVFNVDEAIFLRKTTHSEIPLTLVSNPAIHAVGHIREVAPVIDAKTGTVLVKVGVDDAPPEMALGSAVVGVGAYEPQRVVRLPWSAATSKEGRLAVWIVDPATKVVALRLVEVEAYEEEAVLIRDGLKEGETVVTDGVKFLYPGQVVDVAEAKS